MKNFELGNSANIYDYENLIPEWLTAGYELTAGLCTTFGLEPHALTRLLIALKCLPIIQKKAIDVFYDVQSFRMNEGDYNILSEECMHGMNLFAMGKKKAFHPKVILLRYEKKVNKDIRYVLIVASKNITTSGCLDAFCVAYGSVREVGLCMEATNGQKLSDWIKGLYSLSEGMYDLKKAYECGIIKYVDELNKVDFKCTDSAVEKLDFLTEKDMKCALKELDDLTIVSPFISDDIVLGEKVTKVVSQGVEFGKLRKETLEKIKERTYVFAEELTEGNGSIEMVHAKIYCGKKEKKTTLILGSSNATTNGCAWKYEPKQRNVTNMEFNVAMTMSEAAHASFWENFSGYVVKVSNYAAQSDGNDMQDRNVLGYFLSSIEGIETEAVTGGWKLRLKIRQDFFNKSEVCVQVLESQEAEFKGADFVTECRCNKAKEFLWVGIKCEDIVQRYCIRIVPYITSKIYLEELEQYHMEDYNQIIKMKINSVFRNSKHFGLPIRERIEDSRAVPQKKTVDKRYVYEKLKMLAVLVKRQCKSEDELVIEYRKQLQLIWEHASLLQGDKDTEYVVMREALTKLLEMEKQ